MPLSPWGGESEGTITDRFQPTEAKLGKIIPHPGSVLLLQKDRVKRKDRKICFPIYQPDFLQCKWQRRTMGG